MFDNTLPVSMSDGSQKRLDDSEMTTSLSVISYNFPNMIDESEGTFTNFTSSNLSGGNQTTSSITSYRSFITSSNYYNINNDLKVSEHAYLFSSGSNDYWSWRKPSDIQVGDYLLGQNKEIRQVSSSEHIVSGTLGLSQINVEDVDTLFVNGYLVHNDDIEGEGGGGGTAYTYTAGLGDSASILLPNESPYPHVAQRGNMDEQTFRIKGAIARSGDTGANDITSVKLGLYSGSVVAGTTTYRYVEFTEGFTDLSGSGTTRDITVELSASAIGLPTQIQNPATVGIYDYHMQITASANSQGGALSTQNVVISNIVTGSGEMKMTPGGDIGSIAYQLTGSDGQITAEEMSMKQIAEKTHNKIDTARSGSKGFPNYVKDDTFGGEQPFNNKGPHEQISFSELYSASLY